MKLYTLSLSIFLLTLIVPLPIFSADDDEDGIDDVLEEQIAYKFAPVLHRHSWDLQGGLQNFDLIVEDPSLCNVKIWSKTLGQEITSQVNTDSICRIHKWRWDEFETFGSGDRQNERAIQFVLSDNIQHKGADAGNRPIYYHIYEGQCHFYLQYWYYFTMNDLREYDQTIKRTFHESDWEHVAIQLTKDSNIERIVPVRVNFYRHEGGKTFVPEHCWWSTSRNDTTYAVSKLQRGFDKNHTHLHIWLAANSHASYNRKEKVLQFVVYLSKGGNVTVEEFFVDNVDYEPYNNDLYFTYDIMENLGEIEYTQEAHGFAWNYHVSPKGDLSKKWLGYQYIMGDDFWKSNDKIYGAHYFSTPFFWRHIPEQYFVFIYSGHLPSVATLPPFGITSPVQPWSTWEEDFSVKGFGNDSLSANYWIISGQQSVYTVMDLPDGD